MGKTGKINLFCVLCASQSWGKQLVKEEMLSQIGNYGEYWHWEGGQGLEDGLESMEKGEKTQVWLLGTGLGGSGRVNSNDPRGFSAILLVLNPAFSRSQLAFPQRLQEREHSVQELVDLHLRVPLEKEIPVSVGPEGPERPRVAEGDEEFPEITEVGLRAWKKNGNIHGVPGISAWERSPAPSSRWIWVKGQGINSGLDPWEFPQFWGQEKQEFSLPFPQEMEKEIKSLFRGGNQDEVLSEAFRLTITRKDIQTLNNLNWLNDEVKKTPNSHFPPIFGSSEGKNS